MELQQEPSPMQILHPGLQAAPEQQLDLVHGSYENNTHIFKYCFIFGSSDVLAASRLRPKSEMLKKVKIMLLRSRMKMIRFPFGG